RVEHGKDQATDDQQNQRGDAGGVAEGGVAGPERLPSQRADLGAGGIGERETVLDRHDLGHYARHRDLEAVGDLLEHAVVDLAGEPEDAAILARRADAAGGGVDHGGGEAGDAAAVFGVAGNMCVGADLV